MVQARTQSARLPRKVLKPIGVHTSALSFLVSRLRLAQIPKKIIVVTSTLDEDDSIASHCELMGVDHYRGDSDNVLYRFWAAAKEFDADVIVRITADCPFVDPFMLDEMLEKFLSSKGSYMCNQHPPTYPDGFDIDIFSRELLEDCFLSAKDPFDLEHVTPFMKKIVGTATIPFPASSDYSHLRVTLDEYEDLIVINRVLEKIENRIDFTWREVVEVLLENPALMEINASLTSPQLNTARGHKLYKRAKSIIPGGNSLLSKRPEMFLPDYWPNYFSRAKGISVWDLDGKRYKDMSIMGIGTNTLGYAYDPVDERVIQAVKNSNMSSLNPPEEVFLADRLLDLHPWFQMAKFARTGAEINSVALRIARVASGRSKVAICGYHGWHDWYLANNIASKDSLSNHLLPGLSADGVPKSLGSEVCSFIYNDFESMRNALNDSDVGVVFMEVMRSSPPLPGFLEEIRRITSEKGIVLIFDECTSGFRQSFGGLHKVFGIYPDMATFGKTLGNGFAITAVLGIDSVMQHASSTFMSSTFWTERIGFVAGLATLDAMESIQSWDLITDLGKKMFEVWEEVSSNNQLELKLAGIPALAAHSFNVDNPLALKTFITQEMLLRNETFASNIFYPSIAHSVKDIEIYSEQLNEILSEAKVLIDNNSLVQALLGPIAHATFSRLN